ncbi:hypothetical protein BD324DRAFT_679573 [Kockovaella imperatae]|uniref:SAP domain-containing protein n=1 Tax=Kockovaella imperatae TaxID=4999 RepID=A0A1Y1UM53_9TREE|nr:hypothetical protein BD324DRAFT_679573 [Kockovaella imperatae]ORX39072.1 hypothetical protein BD324DRAFT_679573 [Kockovaella imperatae]
MVKMADDILHNSPALHALKRHQLVSLSKKYGLRSSGKNDELIHRLQECMSINPWAKLNTVEVASTLSGVKPPSLPPLSFEHDLGDFANQPAESPDSNNVHPPRAAHAPRPSDGWEVLSESNASIVSPDREMSSKHTSVSSWKSAGNGESLSEFGEGEAKSKSSRSTSLRAFANMTRRASIHLLSRSHSAPSAPASSAPATPAPPHLQQRDNPVINPEPIETIIDEPPSPASAVGVPRRHSTMSLLERPSTLRLVSPPPTSDIDNLPFSAGTTNLRKMKERRSMAPIKAQGQGGTALNRRSMPALRCPPAYPNILPPMPGSFTPAPTLQHKESSISITNAQFEDAGRRVMAEMEAKMKAHMGDKATSFGQELLKGKNADLGNLVRVNSNVRHGGWGLASNNEAKKDRYAEIHAREFKKMQSIDQIRKPSGGSTKQARNASGSRNLEILTAQMPTIPATPGQKRKVSNLPSAPNGLPLEASDDRDAKRKRLSFGPNTMGSLRGAGKSLVNVIGDMGRTPKRAGASRKKAAAKKRRSSITAGKGRGISARLGFFSRKKASIGKTIPTNIAASGISTIGQSSGAHLPERVAKQRVVSGASSHTTSVAKGSTTSSRSRPRLPEFGGESSTSGSINSLGLPQGGTLSLKLSDRKQSQAQMIRKARPAPAPPAASLNRIELDVNGCVKPNVNLSASTSSMKRSSTLLQPTASSSARMQATVKPSFDRPLPSVPKTKIPTAKPFGQGSSRDTSTFDSSFNVPKPSLPPPSAWSSPPHEKGLVHTKSTSVLSGPRAVPAGPRAPLRSSTMVNLKSPGKSPGKTSSIAGKRARERAGGVSSIKARGNANKGMETAQRRAEIRAKQERLGEERQLRDMLGGMGHRSSN